MQTKAGPITYPSGALVRVSDICGDRKRGRAGLLPIHPSTWYEWVAAGRVPAGCKLGENTTVWPIETVLALGRGEPAADSPSPGREPPAPAVAVAESALPTRGGPKRGPAAGGVRAVQAVPA